MQGYTHHKESGKHALSRAINKASVTGSKKVKIYKFPDKEFKITVLGKVSELPENTDRPSISKAPTAIFLLFKEEFWRCSSFLRKSLSMMGFLTS